jgi:hypothetical protein
VCVTWVARERRQGIGCARLGVPGFDVIELLRRKSTCEDVNDQIEFDIEQHEIPALHFVYELLGQYRKHGQDGVRRD